MTVRWALVLLLSTVAADAEIRIKAAAERKKAPQFELEAAGGKTVRLADHSGRVVLVDFWATWCAPCKGSIPWFNELAAKHKDAGLDILAISMDSGGWDVVAPYIDKHGMRYPVLLGTPRVAYLYGDVEELPLAFFIDRKQRVAAIHPGVAKRKDFERILETLLGEPQ